jgi:two-component system chemotaxis response regulator CheB
MDFQKLNIIVIGSSAGGVPALKELVKSFNKDLAASIFIVQHLAADKISYLPEILSSHGVLPARHPQDGEQISKGTIYIAPPDHHMIIENEHIFIKRGPKENNFRPAIDVTMRSAAYWYADQVIAAVLTGYLSDGSSGLWSVQQLGGTTIVQSPEDADYPDMPRNALERIDPDYILPLKDIGPLINTLLAQPTESKRVENDELKTRMNVEIEIAGQKNAFSRGIHHMGEKTALTCPECGGSLTSLQEGSNVRYRCHTGHGFSSSSLWSGITESVEAKLWQAMRSMEEGILFLEQAVTRCELSGNQDHARGFEKKADILRTRSKALLDYIYTQGQINDKNLS